MGIAWRVSLRTLVVRIRTSVIVSNYSTTHRVHLDGTCLPNFPAVKKCSRTNKGLKKIPASLGIAKRIVSVGDEIELLELAVYDGVRVQP